MRDNKIELNDRYSASEYKRATKDIKLGNIVDYSHYKIILMNDIYVED